MVDGPRMGTAVPLSEVRPSTSPNVRLEPSPINGHSALMAAGSGIDGLGYLGGIGR